MQQVMNDPDHPRSRGVYPTGRPIPGRPPGSSPLARGLPPRPGPRRAPPRIIPARAGFTAARAARLAAAAGSSPLARGLPTRILTDHRDQGIIPARAGFTRCRPGGPFRAEDHPRSRGVYAGPVSAEATWDGSSPLARGLHGGLLVGPGEPRIIPARAGFTFHAGCRLPSHGDHPRSRGVYYGLWLYRLKNDGSSPLARGLPPWPSPAHLDLRIIPARAGFTVFLPVFVGGAQDHPRSRGVYLSTLGRLGHWFGSSPLARGLRPVRGLRMG